MDMFAIPCNEMIHNYLSMLSSHVRILLMADKLNLDYSIITNRDYEFDI